MSRKSKAAEFLQDVWDINVTGRYVLVTEAMKNYAIDKISKIEKFSDRVQQADVIMDIQKLDHHVDIILKIENTKIKVSGHSDNMYASIDKAVDRLKKQIRRYRQRQKNHRSLTHEEVAMNVNVYRPIDDLTELNDEIDEESSRQLIDEFVHSPVIKTETKPLKTLTIDEALLKIELSGDKFMIFRSEEDHKIKVIYARDDGSFGIIEPEK